MRRPFSIKPTPKKKGDEEPYAQYGFLSGVFKFPADQLERFAVAPEEEEDQAYHGEVAQDARECDEHEAYAALFHDEK